MSEQEKEKSVKIPTPNSEIRIRTTTSHSGRSRIRISDLGLLSDFGLRTSDLLPLLAFLTLLTSPSASAADPAPASRQGIDSLFGDDTLAQGKGVKVTSSQLEQAFVAFKANLASRGERINESERTFREAQLLDRLVITQILTNH